MPEVIVAKTSDFADPGRKVFEVGGVEVGVFQLGGEFYAWENRCPHYDGPACQGRIIPETTEAVNDDKTSRGREFSKTEMNVSCPWHGMEFNIRTGRHPTNNAVRLRSVPLRIAGGDIYLSIREPRR
ncbi:MAG: Rieske (2Fe-2S) protein [Beijerinckiaceae bacterium]